MEIFRNEELKVKELDVRKFLRNIFDCYIRMRDQPKCLCSYGRDNACYSSCNDRSLTCPRRSLNECDSILDIIGKDGPNSSLLRGVQFSLGNGNR